MSHTNPEATQLDNKTSCKDLKILMLAPQAFFSVRGIPFSVFHHICALIDEDLITGEKGIKMVAGLCRDILSTQPTAAQHD